MTTCPPRLTTALRAYALCALETARLLIRHQLRLPSGNVGRRLAFADGTFSRVYRETIRTGVTTARPTTLIVQFRLRLIGHNRLMHALFRAESLLNTVLFAGFPGFRSTLWATDERTAVYRGVYEWTPPRPTTTPDRAGDGQQPEKCGQRGGTTSSRDTTRRLPA